MATNGGPFHADGTGVGVVISDGQVVHANYGGVGFGSTVPDSDGAFQWVIGTIANASQMVPLQQFVTGFDWLVRDGVNVADDNTTGARRSARTAIGVDWDGKLVLLVADGCELWCVFAVSVFG